MKPARQLLMMFLMCLSVGGAAIFHVSVKLSIIQEGYSLSEETRANKRLLDERRKLQLERSLLRSPERIAAIARSEFGLEPPAPEQIRVIKAQQ